MSVTVKDGADVIPRFAERLISIIAETSNVDSVGVQRVKSRLSAEMGLGTIPRNSVIRAHILSERRQYIERYGADIIDRILVTLIKKPMRTVSGVAPVAIMSPPHACPHGRCSYCPGGLDKGTPQSYTGREPAALRARNEGYDPYAQVRARMEQYQAIGHCADKVDLIVMGGTFTATPPHFQSDFVKRAFDALNHPQPPAKSLAEAKAINEEAGARCIGLTIESRPDWCMERQINMILALGGTRVELGVQCLDDTILAHVNRGHDVKASIEATRALKDAGLKVCYHLMPNMPGSNEEKDLAMFRRVFQDPDFRPDMLKIYPTLVIEGTELYDEWKAGKYRPYPLDHLVDLLARVKAELPPYIRIQRIQRDIPSPLIIDGPKKSNLRQIVHERMKERGLRCRCIRCREMGHRGVNEIIGDVKRTTYTYRASEGEEVFLSLTSEDESILYGYLRLRIPSERVWRPELRRGRTAIVRELKVVGPSVGFGRREGMHRGIQHNGLGIELMAWAEAVALEEYDAHYVAVNSGIGVRNYYRRLGYHLNGVYMVKDLRGGG